MKTSELRHKISQALHHPPPYQFKWRWQLITWNDFLRALQKEAPRLYAEIKEVENDGKGKS